MQSYMYVRYHPGINRILCVIQVALIQAPTLSRWLCAPTPWSGTGQRPPSALSLAILAKVQSNVSVVLRRSNSVEAQSYAPKP